MEASKVIKIPCGVSYVGDDWREFIKANWNRYRRIEVRNPYGLTAGQVEGFVKQMKPSNDDWVVVMCYGAPEVWTRRKASKRFYEEAMLNTEGSESERYLHVYCDLTSGKRICNDWV